MADDPTLIGKIRRKLIDTKEKWAAEGRRPTGRSGAHGIRLPPGQHEVKNWPVLDLGVQPHIVAAEWKIEISGAVERPITWDWAEFRRQPAFRDVSDIHCVTAWSRFDNRWEGVSARHVISCVRPKPETRFVVFHSYDDYTTNVPFADFDDSDVLLAHSWENRPITREHGGPVRIILPKLYLWKSAKWIRRIEFRTDDAPGFWEVRGYHNHGDPWTEERYG